MFYVLDFVKCLQIISLRAPFWNFDALFQPQQHPARDAHDTFFLKGKAEIIFFDLPLIKNHFIYCRSPVFV